MKRIAIITMGVRLNNEKGYTRFRYLSDFLVKAGYDVDLITTSFQHWEKKQRDLQTIKKEDYSFHLKFIYEPGYKKNVDPARIRSHRIAARNLTKMLTEDGQYDLIYAEIPPNDVALAAGRFAGEHGIPFVVDVNDLWPEAMRMVFDVPMISHIIFHPLLRDAETVYRLASGVVGTSDEYRDRPFLHRQKDIPAVTVYVGNDIAAFDAGAKNCESEVTKPDGEFWVGYAGTIGTSYDIETMVRAGEELAHRGVTNVRFKILGGGPTKDRLEALVKEHHIGNVEFVGYAPYEKMAAYLIKCDVLVNSFVKKAPQSIVTKIGDYLAAGRPMINTCSSPEFCAKVEHDGFGINIEAENASVLSDAVMYLHDDPTLCKKMGQKARRIAEEQFDRPQSYRKIEELMKALMGERHAEAETFF